MILSMELVLVLGRNRKHKNHVHSVQTNNSVVNHLKNSKQDFNFFSKRVIVVPQRGCNSLEGMIWTELQKKQTWSGWATSEKITSTMPTSMRYLAGCLASSMMGITLVRFFAMLTKSLPLLWENSTAYTTPVYKQIKHFTPHPYE